MAQRLGAGLQPRLVAGIERIACEELEALLGDAAFAALVEHYRALAGKPLEERRAWLMELARQMLERLVATGDLRAIALVLSEEGRGQDPAVKLTGAVETALVRVVTPPSMGGLPEPRAPREPAAAGSSAAAAARIDPKPGGCGRDHPSHEPADGAGPAQAMRVAKSLPRGLAQLRTKLLAEAEQIGMAMRAARAARAEAEEPMHRAADARDRPREAPVPGAVPGTVLAARLPDPVADCGGASPLVPAAGGDRSPTQPRASPVRHPPYRTPLERAGPPGTCFMAETRFKLV